MVRFFVYQVQVVEIDVGKGGLDVKFRIFALDCGSAGNVDKGIWIVDLDGSEIRVVLER